MVISGLQPGVAVASRTGLQHSDGTAAGEAEPHRAVLLASASWRVPTPCYPTGAAADVHPPPDKAARGQSSEKPRCLRSLDDPVARTLRAILMPTTRPGEPTPVGRVKSVLTYFLTTPPIGSSPEPHCWLDTTRCAA
jgi:hypothetical protein